MNFNWETLKKQLTNKKFLTIVVAVVAVVAIVFGGKAIKQHHEAHTVLSGIQLTYSGYSGHGVSHFEETSDFDAWKKIARVEGKKAGIDSSTIEALINNSQSPSELKSNLNSNSTVNSVTDSLNLKTFTEHMNSTTVQVNTAKGLANGDKQALTVIDKSPNPFIKAQSRILTVKGLKKSEQINISSFAKQLYLKSTGTNNHGTTTIQMRGNDPEGKNLSQTNLAFPFDQIFKIDPNKAVSNGQKFSISEVEFAKQMNLYNTKKQYIGKANKKITFTVRGLKKEHIQIKNINQIATTLLRKDGQPDRSNVEFYRGFLDENTNDNGMHLFFRDKDNHEKIYSYSCDAMIKNGYLYAVKYKESGAPDEQDEILTPYRSNQKLEDSLADTKNFSTLQDTVKYQITECKHTLGNVYSFN